MNTTFSGIVNGIAVAAKAKSPPDQNTIALMQEILTRVEYALGTVYDAAATNATLILNYPEYPAAAISPSFDTQTATGVTNIRLIGG